MNRAIQMMMRTKKIRSLSDQIASMGKQRDPNRMGAILEAITANPSQTKSEIARLSGTHFMAVERALVQFEEVGILLVEEEDRISLYEDFRH